MMNFKLLVKILAAKDLPVMNEVDKSTDAYVEVRYKSDTFKTDVVWKTLDPVWDSNIFEFIGDDNDLIHELLQISVYDHDSYISDNLIGKININLFTLFRFANDKHFNIWIPIYNPTIENKGKIHFDVHFYDLSKIKTDFVQNEFDNIKLFSSPHIPEEYMIENIKGFVFDQVYCDACESKFSEMIKSTQYINDYKQQTLNKLSNKIQQNIINQTIQLRGNAVIGYKQTLNIVNESCFHIRSTGTCVKLRKKTDINYQEGFENKFSKNLKYSKSICSNETSDLYKSSQIPLDNIHIFTFENSSHFSTSFIGQYVSSYLVLKLSNVMDEIGSNESLSNYRQTKDIYWKQLQNELRSHAYYMGCDTIFGYTENENIAGEYSILHAYGTAVILTEKISTGFFKCSTIHNSMMKNICQFCKKFTAINMILSSESIPSKLKVNKSLGMHFVSVSKEIRNEKHEDFCESISQTLVVIESEIMTKFVEKIKKFKCNSCFDIKTQYSFNNNKIVMLRMGNFYQVYMEKDILSPQESKDNHIEILPNSFSEIYVDLSSALKLKNEYSNYKEIEPVIDTKRSDIFSNNSLNYEILTYIQPFIINSLKLEDFKKYITQSFMNSRRQDTMELNILINLNFDELYFFMFINKTEIIKRIQEFTKIKNNVDSHLFYKFKSDALNLIMSNFDFIHTQKEKSYINLGYINYYHIKHTEELTDEENITKEVKIFIDESIYLFQSIVISVGGNAISSFGIDQFKIINHSKKNQAELILCVSGNALKLSEL